jgi:glycosyltransferase involved in cell wall biosynthesis
MPAISYWLAKNLLVVEATMNIYGYMITKNEADRYLEDALYSMSQNTDGFVVFDDRSTDDTPKVVEKFRVPYKIAAGPSFSDHEAMFREQAWRFMEVHFKPRLGDWILTLDADETLRTSVPLKEICRRAERESQDALWMHVHELWGPNAIRIDGAWGTIRALRLAAYKPNGRFEKKQNKMGGGSLPDYTKNVGATNRAEILHSGYLKAEDRKAKYERYSQTQGRHVRRHIDSILTEPMLAEMPRMV